MLTIHVTDIDQTEVIPVYAIAKLKIKHRHAGVYDIEIYLTDGSMVEMPNESLDSIEKIKNMITAFEMK